VAQDGRPEDLGTRTERFAADTRGFLKPIPTHVSSFEDARQLARSSGSVAANWIEADEALTLKDRIYRFKICRKEAKGSGLWLRLIEAGPAASERAKLLQESGELLRIFSSIIQKLQG
jgi:four helix bundle protein